MEKDSEKYKVSKTAQGSKSGLAPCCVGLFGKDLFGREIKQKMAGLVAERFLAPPFSVLDARSGDWKKRKAAWIRMGINSEVGRLGNEDILPPSAKDDYARLISNSATGAGVKGGVSVFDPMLCEIMYRWFCPKEGQIVDPFAGGSVRGIVAHKTGFKYWGCDLSKAQVEANKKQADVICRDNAPQWVCGDSLDLLSSAPSADFIFSCPPYGDLEKYSDDPRDISNMEYHTFIAAYRRIILRAIKALNDNRFACFVVGDFRDKKGFMRNFVSETITAFEVCGAKLYNEAILITNVGSAAMRATRQFNAGRKMCKTHQNVLVFCKGDWRKATDIVMDR